MRKTIIVDITSEEWPIIDLTVMVCPLTEDQLLRMWKSRSSGSLRQNQYDIAYPQFEVQVTNALRSALSEIVQQEKFGLPRKEEKEIPMAKRPPAKRAKVAKVMGRKRAAARAAGTKLDEPKAVGKALRAGRRAQDKADS